MFVLRFCLKDHGHIIQIISTVRFIDRAADQSLFSNQSMFGMFVLFAGRRRQRGEWDQRRAARHAHEHGQRSGQEELGQGQVEVQEVPLLVQMRQQSEGEYGARRGSRDSPSASASR